MKWHPFLAFLVKHARRLMLRYQVGRDGRAAYELHAGKLYRRQLVACGERVLHAHSTGRCKISKIGSQVHGGGFIGSRDHSHEMLIMTSSGVYKTRNVRTRPVWERWFFFEFLTTWREYTVETESRGGRDGS